MLSPKLIFVLPAAGGGGGANSVVQEATGLRRFGVPVSIALPDEHRSRFAANYPELQISGVPLLTYGTPESLAALAMTADIVCATTNGSVRHLASALELIKGPMRPRTAYYVQDYEPLFYRPRSPEWEEARRSYTLLPGCALFAKTQWLCNLVYENHGVRVAKVEPSIDHEIYFPDLSRPPGRLSIAAMLRPQTPRRAPLRTLRIMEQLLERHGDDVDLHVFGSHDSTLMQMGIRLSSAITNHGSLRRTEVPALLRNSDLFLDLSDFQAFGRTGLESMASGCVAVVPNLGGSSEYAQDRVNCYAVDTRSDDEILSAVTHFVSLQPEQRKRMRLAGLDCAAGYSVARAVLSELALFDSISQ